MERRIELKNSLEEIRDSIDIAKKVWIHRQVTNCYAYALGIDMHLPIDSFQPGAFSGYMIVPPFSYTEIIRAIVADFNALGIDYGSIDPKDSIKDDSWKIALLLPGKDVSSRFHNFHFIRQFEDGIWYHKRGYGSRITNLDDYDDTITNPERARFKDLSYDSCFRLRLK